MSQVQPDVDLAALARPETALQPPGRGKLRIVVPLVLLLGFAAVLASTLTDLFGPVHEVTVVRPVRPSAEQARCCRGQQAGRGRCAHEAGAQAGRLAHWRAGAQPGR